MSSIVFYIESSTVNLKRVSLRTDVCKFYVRTDVCIFYDRTVVYHATTHTSVSVNKRHVFLCAHFIVSVKRLQFFMLQLWITFKFTDLKDSIGAYSLWCVNLMMFHYLSIKEG